MVDSVLGQLVTVTYDCTISTTPQSCKKLAILIVKSDIVYKPILINFTLHIS